jgi:hypothetical protein
MRRKSRRPHPPSADPKIDVRYLIAGGSMLAMMGVLIDFRGLIKPSTATSSDVCETMVAPQSVLSRDELAQLLTVPERDRKDAVREKISEPYCTLPSLEIRAGVEATREAYPLEFDPQTWFVVLYEGDEYAGYSFVFQR